MDIPDTIEAPYARADRALSTRADWLDRAALGASFLCLLHCLALPLLLAALPALAKLFAIPESFHIGVLIFALPTSGFALVSGRARHGATWPLGLGLVGLILMALGALWLGQTPAETPVTVAGSLTLAAGHIANWRLRHRRGCQGRRTSEPTGFGS